MDQETFKKYGIIRSCEGKSFRSGRAVVNINVQFNEPMSFQKVDILLCKVFKINILYFKITAAPYENKIGFYEPIGDPRNVSLNFCKLMIGLETTYAVELIVGLLKFAMPKQVHPCPYKLSFHFLFKF